MDLIEVKDEFRKKHFLKLWQKENEDDNLNDKTTRKCAICYLVIKDSVAVGFIFKTKPNALLLAYVFDEFRGNGLLSEIVDASKSTYIMLPKYYNKKQQTKLLTKYAEWGYVKHSIVFLKNEYKKVATEVVCKDDTDLYDGPYFVMFPAKLVQGKFWEDVCV